MLTSEEQEKLKLILATDRLRRSVADWNYITYCHHLKKQREREAEHKRLVETPLVVGDVLTYFDGSYIGTCENTGRKFVRAAVSYGDRVAATYNMVGRKLYLKQPLTRPVGTLRVISLGLKSGWVEEVL
jgi:hypothetical protein